METVGAVPRPEFDLQPHLSGDLLELRPLRADDFDALYAAASDPMIWQQHPCSDRHEAAVFKAFFAEALESRGALAVIDPKSGRIIGCSRYYELDPERGQVVIGYTFLQRQYWGGAFNRELKRLMLAHAFKFVSVVHFHVDEDNLRSRKAMEKIGGRLVGELSKPKPKPGAGMRTVLVYAVEKGAAGPGLALPARKSALLDRLARELAKLEGVVGVVLGGSHARGVFHDASDLDIGIYYRESNPFRVADIARIAREHDRDAVVTGFYEWGPWVNGGAWIQAEGCKVDFIYRQVEQVRATLEEARQGRWQVHYDQLPPFGFRSVVYLGETAYAVPLHDPEGEIARLKEYVAAYPPALKRGLLESMLGGGELSLMFARKFAERGDVPNTVACLARIHHYLLHALYALNETFFLNDKASEQILAGFAAKPRDFLERSSRVLARCEDPVSGLAPSVDEFSRLLRETMALYPAYRAKFPAG